MGYDITMLRGKIQEAFMGYMKVNLIRPPEGSCWGYFNDRVFDKGTIDDLVTDFGQEYVDNCSNLRAIEVGVKPDWLQMNVDDIPKTAEGFTIGELPMLELSPQGKTAVLPDNLWFFGGNHRREALRIYLDKLRQEVKELKDGVNRILVEQSSEFLNEREKEGNKLESLRKRLAEKIGREEMWVVRLYNRGAPEEMG
jgi:hypothetical protein